MTWRRLTGWEVAGTGWCFGLDRRDYRFEVRLSLGWPAVWRRRDDPPAEPLTLDVERFHAAAAERHRRDNL